MATPESVGLDGAKLCALVAKFEEWKEANLHGVVVVRHGKLAFEHYFRGFDRKARNGPGIIDFSATTTHDLRSMTKSVTALSLGAAIERCSATRGSWRSVSRGRRNAIWAGLASHGKPIQYAHVPAPLALRDVWTPIAGPPVAFEPPSAGFAVDWRSVVAMRARGIVLAALTHAAGISSTGDTDLDNLLPFDEPYSIPAATVDAIRVARGRGGRVVAIGTTVVRALEAAGAPDGSVRAGNGIATGRIVAGTRLRIVDALLTGAHEPGTSHHALLGAFLDQTMLRRVDAELAANHYRTHEFGDSVLMERGVGSRRFADRPRRAEKIA